MSRVFHLKILLTAILFVLIYSSTYSQVELVSPSHTVYDYLKRMQLEGIIRSSGTHLMLHNHQVVFSADQLDRIQQLEDAFSESPYLTPSVNECIGIVGEEVYKALISQGKIVEITRNVVFNKKDLDQIIQETRSLLENDRKISAGEFRDHFNTTRKYAIALLEYLDENRITERIGDFRVLKTS